MELIGYLSNGYPTIAKSHEMAELLGAGGCDSLLIDFPAKDADMETDFIKGRMETALKACEDYDRYMDNIMEIRRFLSKIHLIVLVYVQTVQEIGVEKFSDFCLSNRIRDVLLLGDKDGMMRDHLAENGLRVSFCVRSDHLSEDREAAEASNGFVCVRFNTNDAVGIVSSLTGCIQILRDQGIELPIYCDIGVSTPLDFLLLKKAKADGAIFGSTALPYHNPNEIQDALIAIKAADQQ